MLLLSGFQVPPGRMDCYLLSMGFIVVALRDLKPFTKYFFGNFHKAAYPADLTP